MTTNTTSPERSTRTMIVKSQAEFDATLDSGDYDAAEVAWSLLYVIVCHRKELDPQKAIDAAAQPTGLDHGWEFVPRDELPESWWEGAGAKHASPTDDGHDAPYPQPCADHPETHVHSLGVC